MDASIDIFDGYVTDREMAAQRGITPRTLRDERQRGNGPPFVRDRRTILYPIAGYRDWLRSNEQRPVRSGQA